jgi:hypothetical protein
MAIRSPKRSNRRPGLSRRVIDVSSNTRAGTIGPGEGIEQASLARGHEQIQRRDHRPLHDRVGRLGRRIALSGAHRAERLTALAGPVAIEPDVADVADVRRSDRGRAAGVAHGREPRVVDVVVRPSVAGRLRLAVRGRRGARDEVGLACRHDRREAARRPQHDSEQHDRRRADGEQAYACADERTATPLASSLPTHGQRTLI